MTNQVMADRDQLLTTLRSGNHKLVKLLRLAQQIIDLMAHELSECDDRRVDAKRQTVLSLLRTRFDKLRIEYDSMSRIDTTLIDLNGCENESESEEDLNLFSDVESSSKWQFVNSDDPDVDTANSSDNYIVLGVSVCENSDDINLVHNYAEVDKSEDELCDDCEYSCEFADTKSGLLCEKKFTTKESLLSHVIGHTGDKPWFCEGYGCDYRAVQRNHLVGHIRKSHTGRYQFRCDWPGCDFSGPSRYNVKRHRIIHTGERPYKCDWPGCDFRSPNNKIAAHKRMHTGERPYPCDWPGCDLKFSRPFTLRNHKRVHTGEKPFVCDWPGCHYKSTQQTPLAAHKRKHHSFTTVASEEVIVAEGVVLDNESDQ